MLVVREESYDAADVLKEKSTYSYHANGAPAESKTVNGEGEVIYLGILDENGNTLYEEYASFHDNGKISQSQQTRYEGDVRTTAWTTYDNNGVLVEREVTQVEGDREIKTEKYNAAGELIYYKDATRLDEMLFTENGTYNGRHTVEYYADGQVKLEKEVNAEGKLVYMCEAAENGVILKDESNTYNANGEQISHSYQENSPSDVTLKSERWELDDNGNIKEKRIAHYDTYGNVTYDEQYENGILVRKYNAEYYGAERPKKEETYQNDGTRVSNRIMEYDEQNRLVYRYECEEFSGSTQKTELLEKLRYNAAGVVIYREFYATHAIGGLTIEEFYDNGNPKKLIQYDKNGNLVSQQEWDENGNLTVSEN